MVLKKPVQLRENSTNGTEQYCVKILGVHVFEEHYHETKLFCLTSVSLEVIGYS